MSKLVENWVIITSGNAFTPPEYKRFHLKGKPAWLEVGSNDFMRSSPIVGSEENGQILVTRSGSRYRLGKPSEPIDLEGAAMNNNEHLWGKTFSECVEAMPYIPLD